MEIYGPLPFYLFTFYIMLLIAVSNRRCGRNFRAKLDTAVNSLSANHAYLKRLYRNLSSFIPFQYVLPCSVLMYLYSWCPAVTTRLCASGSCRPISPRRSVGFLCPCFRTYADMSLLIARPSAVADSRIIRRIFVRRKILASQNLFCA